MDWKQIADTAKDVSPEGIKEALSILYVLEANDHFPAKQEAGRFKFYSPFRTDSDPSFDVFVTEAGVMRWGDFAEGSQGDVLDLVARFFKLLHGRDPSFPERIAECRRYIAEADAAGWTGPKIVPRKAFDLEAAKATYAESLDKNTGVLARLLTRRADRLQTVDADWLKETFRLGELSDRIVVPYFNRDDELVAYKHRNVGGTMISAPGSGLYDHVLYGEWRDDDPSKPVVLCEGESDTWAATDALGDSFIALGLPTGASRQPKQAGTLDGRTIYLCFDGDKAGRGAIMAWVAALSRNNNVFIVPMPDGMDVAKCPDLKGLIRRARPPISVPDNAPRATPNGYVRPAASDKQVDEILSNWTFDPERELQYESGTAYDGIFEPIGSRTVITSADLANKQALVRWSNRNGGAWYGSDRDAQMLLAQLQSAGVFLPSGRMTEIAGLHDGQFVWPGGQIGHDKWSYLPPTTNVQLDKSITINEGPWVPEQIPALRALHHPRVIDPILCWLAVAPLRSLVDAFPVLAVTGGSGSGKTTLLETVVPRFSGSSITSNLTGTTGYAVGAYAGSTNAFPVWFDEFRPGARKDTLETFAQVLRDAYTGQSSSKGGMNRNNVSEVSTIDAIAPIIVSGEDAFTEQSHTERMVLVHLPVDGKNAAALEAVQSWEAGPFAYAYLKWLVNVYIEDPKMKLKIVPAGPAGLPSRVRYNLGVLKYGWSLLQQFMEANGSELEGRPDFSLVGKEAAEAALTNPIREALIWALEEDEKESGVYRLPGYVAVRAESFVAYVHKRGTFTLPGGSTAVKKYLMANYGATSQVFSVLGVERQGLVIDADRL